MQVTKRAARSSPYFGPEEASSEDLVLMRAMDRQYLARFCGSRPLKVWLAREGWCVSWKRVQRLMRILGPAGHLPAAQHLPKVSRASDLSLPVGKDQSYPPQPGVGR